MPRAQYRIHVYRDGRWRAIGGLTWPRKQGERVLASGLYPEPWRLVDTATGEVAAEKGAPPPPATHYREGVSS